MVAVSFNHLKETGNVPRVHPNGFIQLDYTDRIRVHFWGHPRIPRQKVYTPIHDHVFGFKSHLVSGRLLNVVYAPLDGMGYSVCHARCMEGEETVLEPTGETVDIAPVYTELLQRNTRCTEYSMMPFVLHETFATEPSVTVMFKDGPTLAQGADRQPRILVPTGKLPDNDFRRSALTEDQLWRIIKEMMK